MSPGMSGPLWKNGLVDTLQNCIPNAFCLDDRQRNDGLVGSPADYCIDRHTGLFVWNKGIHARYPLSQERQTLLN